jgi:hypothetical protein
MGLSQEMMRPRSPFNASAHHDFILCDALCCLPDGHSCLDQGSAGVVAALTGGLLRRGEVPEEATIDSTDLPHVSVGHQGRSAFLGVTLPRLGLLGGSLLPLTGELVICGLCEFEAFFRRDEKARLGRRNRTRAGVPTGAIPPTGGAIRIRRLAFRATHSVTATRSAITVVQVGSILSHRNLSFLSSQ